MDNMHPDAVPIHRLFGLPPNFSDEQLHEAYNKLRVEYTKGGKPQKFKNLTNMYQIALCPHSRRKYYSTGSVELALETIHLLVQDTAANKFAKRETASAVYLKLLESSAEKTKKRVQATLLNSQAEASSLNSSTSEPGSLTKKNEEFHSEISEKSKKRDTMISKLKPVEREIEVNEGQLKSLSAQNSKIQREIKEQERGRHKLQKLLDNSSSIHESLKEKVAEKDTLNASLQAQLQSIKAEELRLRSETSQAQKQIDVDKKALEHARSLTRKLQSEIETQRTHCEKKRETEREMSNEINDLQKLQEEFEQKRKKQEHRTVELESQLASAISANDDLKSQLADEAATTANLSGKLESLRRIKIKKESKLTEAGKEVERLEESVTLKHSEAKQLQLDLDDQRKHCGDLLGQIQALSEFCEEKRAEMVEIMEKFTHEEQNLRNEQLKIDLKIRSMQERIAVSAVSLKELESLSLAKAASLTTLQQQLELLQNNVTEIQDGIRKEELVLIDAKRSSLKQMSRIHVELTEYTSKVSHLILVGDGLKLVSLNLEKTESELETQIKEARDRVNGLQHQLNESNMHAQQLPSLNFASPVDLDKNRSVDEEADEIFKLVAVEEFERLTESDSLPNANKMELLESSAGNTQVQSNSKPRPRVPVASKYFASSGRYACDICGKEYTNYKACSNHRSNKRIHPPGGVSPAPRAYSCRICEQDFSRKDKLKAHMRSKHKGTIRIK